MNILHSRMRLGLVLTITLLIYLFYRWARFGKNATSKGVQMARRRQMFDSARTKTSRRFQAQTTMSKEGFDRGEFALLPSGVTHYLLSPDVDGSSGFVVLIHGFGVFSFIYQTFVDDLITSKRRVLAYDLYGHGFSETESDVYNLDLFVDQLIELLEHLHLNRTTFCLFGHSMGGLVATEFAQRYPNKIERLALLCPAGSARIRLSTSIRSRSVTFVAVQLAQMIFTMMGPSGVWLLATITRKMNKPFESQMLSAMCGKMKRVSSNAVMRSLGNRFLNMNAMILFGLQFQVLSNPHHTVALQSILKNMNLFGDHSGVFARCHDAMSTSTALTGLKQGSRIVIFWGTDDECLPHSNMEKLKIVMPSAQLVSFQDCDHFLFLNRPDEFSAAALRFLNGCTHRSPSAPVVWRRRSDI
eukprot:GEMP01038369.1.p1 GENE.GEMP01038369.1~~GEMP01038369.1.p1  ORF type:complete len:414 (+),score=48.14 GEMP01038369.1:99-1340(+)